MLAQWQSEEVQLVCVDAGVLGEDERVARTPRVSTAQIRAVALIAWEWYLCGICNGKDVFRCSSYEEGSLSTDSEHLVSVVVMVLYGGDEVTVVVSKSVH